MSAPDASTHVSIRPIVNDRERRDTVPAGTLLSAYLREDLDLTGTHRGCETAKCGACTVLVDGEAVKSCNMLAVQVDGREVTTIEGLGGDGELHPIQRAFWDLHGMQCGFCTPGFVLAAAGLLERNPDPGPDEIRRALAGNLCRCTGYTKIVESVRAAADDIGGGSRE